MFLTFQFADDDLKDDDFEHNRVLLYPLLIAAATVVALIIIIVAVWQRYRYIKGIILISGVVLYTSLCGWDHA